MRPFENPAVSAHFAAYPSDVRRRMMALRELIFKTAAATEGVGELEEALNWSEPAYLTSQSRSGSTVRIDWKAREPARYATYFNCQTDLVDTFCTLFPKDFRFEGNRALVFERDAALPNDALTLCIAAALTYHRRRQP